MRSFMSAAARFVKDDSGATMVEYALMVALVAAACVAAATTLGTAVSGKFSDVAADV